MTEIILDSSVQKHKSGFLQTSFRDVVDNTCTVFSMMIEFAHKTYHVVNKSAVYLRIFVGLYDSSWTIVCMTKICCLPFK